ncbi:RDD family protein [Aliidiomarina halalkaliphila]|uniref:RDD family protein n=1 Tax=Aliidiomarina halalkaliphila TaxID=2593535 RepID=A0A552X164_9GAMM|nr:RDD family protein [Aliidiomarina halalkaliphila]TRW48705.1 RDD family protein [Aliidiomarina halalkaliphila]
MNDIHYAGFWVRVGAALIDTVLLMMVVLPVLFAIYGFDYWRSDARVLGFWDLLFNYIFPAVVIILFWVYRSATPGKMLLGLKIVDAETGLPVPTARLIGRYLGYYVSTLPLLLGIIWVGIDNRKQGWHDKLAGTVVIHDPPRKPY